MIRRGSKAVGTWSTRQPADSSADLAQCAVRTVVARSCSPSPPAVRSLVTDIAPGLCGSPTRRTQWPLSNSSLGLQFDFTSDRLENFAIRSLYRSRPTPDGGSIVGSLRRSRWRPSNSPLVGESGQRGRVHFRFAVPLRCPSSNGIGRRVPPLRPSPPCRGRNGYQALTACSPGRSRSASPTRCSNTCGESTATQRRLCTGAV